MKDSRTLKSQIRIPSGKEKELDEFLEDTALVAQFELMCDKTNVNLPTYIQFLMEKKIPGNPRFHKLAEMILERAKMERPWIFS